MEHRSAIPSFSGTAPLSACTPRRVGVCAGPWFGIFSPDARQPRPPPSPYALRHYSPLPPPTNTTTATNNKQEEDSYDVVVCHANVIRYFVCKALQLPPEAWLRFSLPHCSITIISIRPSGTVSVRCLGDSGFLPPDAITYG